MCKKINIKSCNSENILLENYDTFQPKNILLGIFLLHLLYYLDFKNANKKISKWYDTLISIFFVELQRVHILSLC